MLGAGGEVLGSSPGHRATRITLRGGSGRGSTPVTGAAWRAGFVPPVRWCRDAASVAPVPTPLGPPRTSDVPQAPGS
jgi:hypothetical protein